MKNLQTTTKAIRNKNQKAIIKANMNWEWELYNYIRVMNKSFIVLYSKG